MPSPTITLADYMRWRNGAEQAPGGAPSLLQFAHAGMHARPGLVPPRVDQGSSITDFDRAMEPYERYHQNIEGDVARWPSSPWQPRGSELDMMPHSRMHELDPNAVREYLDNLNDPRNAPSVGSFRSY